MPLELGFVSIKPSNLIMSALKKAEDRDSYILRLYNPTGEAVRGNIEVYSKLKEAYLTDLNEERLEVIPVNSEHNLQIEAGSNKIVTVELCAL